jgi:hypothetical protein
MMGSKLAVLKQIRHIINRGGSNRALTRIRLRLRSNEFF